MKPVSLYLVAFAAAGLSLTASADGAMREGNWSITTTIKMDGMDALSGESAPTGMLGVTMNAQGLSMNSTKCITHASPVPDMAATQGCGTPQIQQSGNTVRYQVACNGPQMQMTADGTMTYTGDALAGETHMHQNENGQKTESTATISGKYLGPCR